MNKKVFAAMTVVAAMFAGYITYNTPNEGELSKIILTNVEALAMNVENNNTHVWCCGNTETCIKGENFKINGKYQLTPCK